MKVYPYEDLAESLALEVKREIAERYFTHRKIIEEDIEAYLENLQELEKEEEAVLRELLRLIFMLRDRDLIKEFEKVTGVPLEPYYDEYFLGSSNIRRRLFKELKSKGFTSKRKFVKLFEETYKRFYKKSEKYREKFNFLRSMAENIQRDIKEFNSEYDLGSIFSFFASLEGTSFSIGGIEEKEKVREELTTRLKFPQIPLPEEKFLQWGALPPWREVGSKLLKLAKEAFRRHTGEAKEILEVLSS